MLNYGWIYENLKASYLFEEKYHYIGQFSIDFSSNFTPGSKIKKHVANPIYDIDPM